jgi:hypothetical protein
MKSLSALLLFLFVFATACDRGPRTTRAATDAEVSARERDMYEDRIEARLDDLEYRFDGLEARRKGLDKAAQERLQVDIDELRDRKDALEEKVDDLHKVSDQSWLDIKASLDGDLDELEAAYNLVSANNQ